MLEKYGSETNIRGISHYETRQVLDEYGRVVVPAGLEVDFNFRFSYMNFSNTIVTVNPVVPFTYYDYEVKLNEEKRRIKILKPEYLNAYISEHREIMEYEDSSDYISKRLKGTYNPRITGV